jgi:hypothetical protein
MGLKSPWQVGQYSPLPSLWGETLISRWLKRRKFVNFSKTDERAIVSDRETQQAQVLAPPNAGGSAVLDAI